MVDLRSGRRSYPPRDRGIPIEIPVIPVGGAGREANVAERRRRSAPGAPLQSPPRNAAVAGAVERRQQAQALPRIGEIVGVDDLLPAPPQPQPQPPAADPGVNGLEPEQRNGFEVAAAEGGGEAGQLPRGADLAAGGGFAPPLPLANAGLPPVAPGAAAGPGDAHHAEQMALAGHARPVGPVANGLGVAAAEGGRGAGQHPRGADLAAGGGFAPLLPLANANHPPVAPGAAAGPGYAAGVGYAAGAGYAQYAQQNALHLPRGAIQPEGGGFVPPQLPAAPNFASLAAGGWVVPPPGFCVDYNGPAGVAAGARHHFGDFGPPELPVVPGSAAAAATGFFQPGHRRNNFGSGFAQPRRLINTFDTASAGQRGEARPPARGEFRAAGSWVDPPPGFGADWHVQDSAAQPQVPLQNAPDTAPSTQNSSTVAAGDAGDLQAQQQLATQASAFLAEALRAFGGINSTPRPPLRGEDGGDGSVVSEVRNQTGNRGRGGFRGRGTRNRRNGPDWRFNRGGRGGFYQRSTNRAENTTLPYAAYPPQYPGYPGYPTSPYPPPWLNPFFSPYMAGPQLYGQGCHDDYGLF